MNMSSLVSTNQNFLSAPTAPTLAVAVRSDEKGVPVDRHQRAWRHRPLPLGPLQEGSLRLGPVVAHVLRDEPEMAGGLGPHGAAGYVGRILQE